MRRGRLAAHVAMTAAGTMLTALAALAADIPAMPARPAAAVVPAAGVLTATDWTGFYVGGHVGHGWVESRGTYDDFGDAGPMDFTAKGFVGGAQGGYLWHIGRLVYGVEADATFGSLDAHRSDNDGAVQRMKTDFLGSGRLITGAAIDNILIFGSIGVGYAQTKFSVAGDPDFGPSSAKVNGWGIASSLGVEMALAPNWSLRGEYIYYGIHKSADLPRLPPASDATDFVKVDGIHVARLAVNYRFNGLQPRAVEPAPNWAGFYAGGHAGYGHARIVGVFNENNDRGSFDIDPRGFAGGLQAGYNLQSGAIVYGIEADGTWTGMKDDRTEADGDTQSLKTSALASVRGRAGIAAGTRMYYLTGGWGFTRAELDVVQGGRPRSVDFDAHGVVIGSGFDWACGPNWSVRLEGLTYLFDKRAGIAGLTPASDPQDYLRQSTVGVIRAGANYRFGGP